MTRPPLVQTWTTTATSVDTVWVAWVHAGTNAVTVANDWTSSSGCAWTSNALTWSAWNSVLVFETSGREWHQAQIERAAQAVEADRALRAEASRRAAELLREYLDARQRDTYEKHRWFEVVSETGRTFRVKHGRAGNVYLVEDGREVARYCIHATENIPDEDNMLAQALLIRASEEFFERTANRTPLPLAA